MLFITLTGIEIMLSSRRRRHLNFPGMDFWIMNRELKHIFLQLWTMKTEHWLQALLTLVSIQLLNFQIFRSNMVESISVPLKLPM